MLLTDPVFLSILFFGLWSSYTDIKEGKIKNKCILCLLLAGFLINMFFTKTIINFFPQTILNLFFTFLISILIWWCKLWSAADAKLLVGFALLLPVTSYHHAYLFPSMTILLNSVVPIFFILVLLSLLKTTYEEKKIILTKIMTPEFLLKLGITMFPLVCLSHVIFLAFGMSFDMISTAILLLVVLELLERVAPLDVQSTFVITSIFLIIFFHTQILTLEFLTNFLSIFFIFIFLIFFIELGKIAFTKEVKIEDLKEGMILAERIVRDKDGFKKQELHYLSFMSIIRQRIKAKPVFEYGAKALRKQDVAEFKKLKKLGLLKFNTIRVSYPMPFAPILSFGCLITYLFHEPIFNF